MSTIIVCDGGCGAQSPDKSGLYVANHWLTVRAGPALKFERLGKYDDKVFCDDCAKRVTDAMRGYPAPAAKERKLERGRWLGIV